MCWGDSFLSSLAWVWDSSHCLTDMGDIEKMNIDVTCGSLNTIFMSWFHVTVLLLNYIFPSFTACMSKYSAGCIYYYPSFHRSHNPAQAEKLQKDLKRYLTRKIGFEAVMRIRCTKGVS